MGLSGMSDIQAATTYTVKTTAPNIPRLEKAQTIGRIIARRAGTWIVARTRTAMVKSPAAGTPAMNKPKAQRAA